jgi:hypothetical protein
MAEGFFLTLHSFFRSFAFLIVNSTLVTLVVYPLLLPMILIMGGYMIIRGAASGVPETSLPMYLQVFNSVWETAINMIIGPIYYLAFTLYYCDLRMRREGLDLIERLDDMEEAENPKRLSSYGV